MPSPARILSLDDSVFDQLLAERIVFLGGEVDTEIANRITAQLLLLAADNPTEDITPPTSNSPASTRRAAAYSTAWPSTTPCS